MLRVVQMGLGPIGAALAARVQREPAMELVGAADPRFDGRDLSELTGAGPAGGTVRTDVVELLDAVRPDLVVHATGSFLEDVAPQLTPVLERGYNLLSTCEELAYPFHRHPELATRLDAQARAGGAVLLGSGVNPGFVMDKLVVTLMAACETVRRVRVERVVDAATRRGPFQKKIGSGLTTAEFETANADGRMGHIGLVESAHMIADAMGAEASRRVERELRPVIASAAMATEHVRIAPGQVAGIEETVVVLDDGVERVRMELQMAVGAQAPHDTVSIDGSPDLVSDVRDGVPGDEGTVNVVIACAPLVGDLARGLRTMLDVPLVPPGARRHA